MTDEWTIKLTRDEGLVLSDYLWRWHQTKDPSFEDEAERQAIDNLFCLLESADDGTLFATDYANQVAAARDRLRPEG